ncbi:MAG: type IV pilus modification protein PilV [Pseudoxanthomonas suwonensis]|nr:type IV pilus modification protein PilV [Pseudoxanthomonas suwonensis]
MPANHLPTPRCTPAAHGQSGTSLIEVMVAVLVLAIGLLGIAALQAITLKNTGSSAARTQATIEAYSMLDIIRANRDSLATFNTNTFVSGDGNGELGTMGGWLDGLPASVAPDAQGRVVCRVGTMTCDVAVRWDDSRGSGGSESQTIQITTQI